MAKDKGEKEQVVLVFDMDPSIILSCVLKEEKSQ